LEAGAAFEFTLSPEEAYGEFTPEAIVPVNKDIFAGHDDMLVIGSIIPMRDAQGNPLNGRILTIDNDKNTVTIDFNHPMAGQTLHFVGKIENVSIPSDDDLQRVFGGCGCSGNCSDGCEESSDCESSCCGK